MYTYIIIYEHNIFFLILYMHVCVFIDIGIYYVNNNFILDMINHLTDRFELYFI